jgi:hypothetical protein
MKFGVSRHDVDYWIERGIVYAPRATAGSAWLIAMNAEKMELELNRRLEQSTQIHGRNLQPSLAARGERLHGFHHGLLDKFQRTRGVLRLMAAVIHTLWERQDGNLLVLPASVPVDDSAVQFGVTWKTSGCPSSKRTWMDRTRCRWRWIGRIRTWGDTW